MLLRGCQHIHSGIVLRIYGANSAIMHCCLRLVAAHSKPLIAGLGDGSKTQIPSVVCPACVLRSLSIAGPYYGNGILQPASQTALFLFFGDQTKTIMDYLRKKRMSTWHKQVAAASHGMQPCELLGDTSREVDVFPYATLSAFTKEYLRKMKGSEEEQDRALIALINQDPNKVLMFASCMSHLSIKSVLDVMSSTFAVNNATLAGLEAYLQAFIAATHGKPDLYSLDDRKFAIALIPLARAFASQRFDPLTMGELFSKWEDSTASNGLLLSHAKLLTRKLCGRTAAVLEPRYTEDWWRSAILYKPALSRLLGGAKLDLVDCLDRAFPVWRCWVAWKPGQRLQTWTQTTLDHPLGVLCRLSGPALGNVDQQYDTLGQALIRKRELRSWLESKGFRVGSAIDSERSEADLAAFVDSLLSIVSRAATMEQSQHDFLMRIINEYGLDSRAFNAWQTGVAGIPRLLPALMASSYQPVKDEALIDGINVLAGSKMDDLRSFLGPRLGEYMVKVAESAQSTVIQRLSTRGRWTTDALRLWTFRSAAGRSEWLQPWIKWPLLNYAQLENPSKSIVLLDQLYNAAQQQAQAGMAAEARLAEVLGEYIIGIVVEGRCTQDDLMKMPAALHAMWSSSSSPEVRRMGLVFGCLETFNFPAKDVCMKRLETLPEAVLRGLGKCLPQVQSKTVETRPYFLALCYTVDSIKRISDEGETCWVELLEWAMQHLDIGIRDAQFTTCGFETYSKWIVRLKWLFSDRQQEILELHKWLSRLRTFTPVIQSLEKRVEDPQALAPLFTEIRAYEQDCFLDVLQCLREYSNETIVETMLSIVLNMRFGSGYEAAKLLRLISAVPTLDEEAFLLLQSLDYHESTDLAGALFNVELRRRDLDAETEATLSEMVPFIRPGVMVCDPLPARFTKPLEEYYASRFAGLLSLARELESNRADIRRRDPNGVDAIIDELGLEQPNPAAQLVAELENSALTDLIRDVAEDTIRLALPLRAPCLNEMEQLAFGLKGSETLFVYLRLDEPETFGGFCVHLSETGDHDNGNEHEFVEISKTRSSPDRSYCHGRSNRLVYLVARQIYKDLKAGHTSLQRLHQTISQLLHSAASQCMICGGNQGAGLHRSTTCKATNCNVTYRRSPLDVRLEDIRSNPRVVDLLLTSLFAAASTGRLELLPDRPPGLQNCAEIIQTLNSLPATANIDCVRLSSRAELLLCWLCTNYRGFILPATSRWSVTGFHSAQQFILVDAAPEIEAAFARHSGVSSTEIMFHGTSIDRLYSVLCQGLRVLSGTNLMQHGAAGGSGIYLASEPSTSMSYARGAGVDVSAPFFSSRSEFATASVLFGVEHAGYGMATPAVHVESDQTRVRILYIFVVQPSTYQAPTATQIKATMQSTSRELRASVARRNMAA